MKKTSKLLIIAVAFALVVSMIPMTGSFAYAAEAVTEISTINVTVAPPLCGDVIENEYIPQPRSGEAGSFGLAEAVNRDSSGFNVTIPEGEGYVVTDYMWLVEDPEGYQGFSLMDEATTVKGENKYYFVVEFMADNDYPDVRDGEDTYYYFADNVKINVTGATLVWSDFWGGYYVSSDDEVAKVEPPAEEEAAEEALAEEEFEEELAVKEEVEEVAEEPEKSHSKGYLYGEAVFEVTAEHVPGDKVEENRVEPTATADGHYDEVVYCEKCGTELSRVTIPIPHTENNDNNNNNNNNDVPKTADETGIFNWMLIMALAAAACIRIKAGSRQ